MTIRRWRERIVFFSVLNIRHRITHAANNLTLDLNQLQLDSFCTLRSHLWSQFIDGWVVIVTDPSSYARYPRLIVLGYYLWNKHSRIFHRTHISAKIVLSISAIFVNLDLACIAQPRSRYLHNLVKPTIWCLQCLWRPLLTSLNDL